MMPGGRGIVSATQEKGWKEPRAALFEMPAIVTMDDVWPELTWRPFSEEREIRCAYDELGGGVGLEGVLPVLVLTPQGVL
jgi:hypothetical protein